MTISGNPLNFDNEMGVRRPRNLIVKSDIEKSIADLLQHHYVNILLQHH